MRNYSTEFEVFDAAHAHGHMKHFLPCTDRSDHFEKLPIADAGVSCRPRTFGRNALIKYDLEIQKVYSPRSGNSAQFAKP